MIGFLVRHPGNGVGRIEAAGSSFRVRFFDKPQSLVTIAADHGRPINLDRFVIGLGSRCVFGKHQCTVKGRKLGKDWAEFHRYEVEFDNGRLDEVAENVLTPDGSSVRPVSPLETLLQLQQEGHGMFSCREALVSTYLQTLRSGVGVPALLASRIDLRPHQAYVAGVVLLDRQQRYLLADEVGLGKTIEAGIIIHDLLSRKPKAHILIICPGALTRQWLCEMYAKFSGRVFCMPELNGSSPKTQHEEPTILSFIGAKERSTQLLAQTWDMVVIDESHHLLAVPELYRLAKNLSAAANGLLLLSALPAQHREEEYLRLLALLDPEHYRSTGKVAAKKFRELYTRQRKLGTVLSWVSRKLPEVAAGERDPKTLIENLRDLTTWPVLDEDQKLRTLVEQLDGGLPSFADDVHVVLHHIGDTHRINRRILRNRRVRLIAQEEIPRIERRLNRLSYKADQFELDAIESVRRLLAQARRAGLKNAVLVPLATLLFQAAADPDLLAESLALASEASRLPKAETDEEALSLETVSGYAGWRSRALALWQLTSAALDKDAPATFMTAAIRWRDVPESRPRFDTLLKFLKTKHRSEPRAKFIVFAGFPGLAERLHCSLNQELPNSPAARFCFGMSDSEKEDEVRRFKRDDRLWVLVSDETGGEGRNFQFVDEVVHYDTPWQVAKVEQRIGRLDRLGRERLDVISNVVYCQDVEEAGLLGCLANGFEIYAQSISGLEFALRDLEREIVLAAIDEGAEGLLNKAPEIKAQAAAERAEDESAELLDEASFERATAEDFRRAQSSRGRERALDRAFVHYFMTMAGPRAIDRRGDADFPEGIVTFQPEDMPREMPLEIPPDENGRLAEHRGTFYRAIAQERPDLEFFSVGSVLFDAVCSTLFKAPKGSAYALECRIPKGEWRGFEFVFRVLGGRQKVQENPGLLNQLDRIFESRLERVWVRETGELAKSPDALLEIRRSLRADTKGALWWNLTGEKAHALEHHYSEVGWTALVTRCFEQARTAARERLVEALSERLGEEHARLLDQDRQLRALKPCGWQDDIAANKLLRRALDSWDLHLDSLGFLSVNGGILQR